LDFVGARKGAGAKVTEAELDISSLMGALKALIMKDETELDSVIAKLEEVKRQLADWEMEAQGLAAKRLKHNTRLRELNEKTEAAKDALDKLMLQTAEQEQYQDRISASVEALKNL
jgi:predicted  nucleic acid-binding Zn-ribbon protein